MTVNSHGSVLKSWTTITTNLDPRIVFPTVVLSQPYKNRQVVGVCGASTAAHHATRPSRSQGQEEHLTPPS